MVLFNWLDPVLSSFALQASAKDDAKKEKTAAGLMTEVRCRGKGTALLCNVLPVREGWEGAEFAVKEKWRHGMPLPLR